MRSITDHQPVDSTVAAPATVALVITHGFNARMFLRSSLLPELVTRVGHIGVFAPPAALETLRAELAGNTYSFYPLHDAERRQDVAASFLRLLLADWKLTRTRRIREREEWERNPWRRALWPLHQRVGSSARLRRAWHALENRLLPDPYHAEAFRSLRPDAVVTATPGVVVGDIRLIRRARAEGVPTVTFVQGWDNLTSKTIIGARPDGLIVWNEHMRDEAVTLHGFDRSQIAVAGAPHFDPYFRRDGWVPRDEYLRALGLDPAKRLVVYATSPQRYFPESLEIVELLVQAKEAGRFGPNVQLVIRLHPQSVEGRDAENLGPYERFRDRAYLDVPRGATGLAADYTPDGIRHLGQLLEAAAVSINVASSITIDAAIFDCPIVNVRFDGRHHKPYLRSARRHYGTEHYGLVVRSGAIRLADSPAQLVDEVNRYLDDPTLERAERVHLVSDLCAFTDGRSGARVADRVAQIAACERSARPRHRAR